LCSFSTYTIVQPLRHSSDSPLRHDSHCCYGKDGREAAGQVHLSYLAQMKLTDERYSRYMTLSASKCSPSGELREAVRGQAKVKSGLWPPGFHSCPFSLLRSQLPQGEANPQPIVTHMRLTEESTNFNEILMIQNEIFSTICIEGKTNEASGRAPSDPPGAQKFKADSEQDPRVPIAFHPRGF